MQFPQRFCKLTPWPTPSSLKQTIQLHAQMVVTGSLLSHTASTHLLKSLSDTKSGNLSLSLTLFSQIPHPFTFHYNTVIRACSRGHLPRKSILLFHQMLRKSVPPDSYTFQFLFKSCSLCSAVSEGQTAHGLFIRLFPESESRVTHSLIHMYTEFKHFDAAKRVFDWIDNRDIVSWTSMVGGLAKAGIMHEAQSLFDEMPERNVVSWTSLIMGYCKTGQAAEAVDVFKKMLADGIVPDAAALVSVLSACAHLRELELGKWVHHYVQHQGIGISENLAVTLIDMYAKCGDVVLARRAFDSIGHKILAAWNAIIDGYCKMGEVDMARTLFDQMKTQDLITFNSMITGYIHSARLKEALLLFRKLRASRLLPDKFTIVGLLTACASLGALDQGKALHGYVEVSSVEPDVFIGTSLVDMYSKCGKMNEAMVVFHRMEQTDVLTWTAIISGLAMNGMGKLALEHFSWMKEEGISPTGVVYVGVLNACSHSGLVEEGRKHFKEMKHLYGITPEIEHYGCMVDILGRCGQLEEAENLIKKMPMEPNDVIWGSLLGSCRVHKNMELAQRVAKQLLQLEPNEDAGYVQLYNIYMDSGRSADASKIRRLMEERGIRKMVGFSSITIGGKAYKFIAGDRLHPEIMEIRKMMSEIEKRLKVAGYSPMTSQVAVEVDEEEKEQALFGHSERMAIAFGIMRLGTNLPIHVIKNLRVCEDCHIAIKLIAKIWSRDIVVRDRSRFHHFKNGQCSCNDFW